VLPNEETSKVVEIHVRAGQFVKKGDLLCTLETTKAAFDFQADESGFIREIRLKEGQEVKTGDMFCYLTKELNSALPVDGGKRDSAQKGSIKATKRALELIEAHAIPAERLPVGQLIREKDIMALLKENAGQKIGVSRRIKGPFYPKNAILLVGHGGHARMCLDIIRRRGEYEPIGLIVPDGSDDSEIGKEVFGAPVVGTDSDLEAFRKDGIRYAVNALGAVKEPALREEIYKRINKADFQVPPLIHPDATVEPSAVIEEGVHVMAQAVVGSNARVARNAIINTGAIVSHDCFIGAHSHIAPGAVLGGDVRVGERSLIGMGVTVYLGLRIGNDVIIRNGLNISSDVGDNARLMHENPGGGA